MKRLLLILVNSCILCIPVCAQHSRLDFFFRQGESTIDSTYMENGKSLDSLTRLLYSVKNNPSFKLERLELNSSFSFEGPKSINDRLKKERYDMILKILTSQISLPANKIVNSEADSTWNILRTLVEGSDMQYRSEVLEIIDNVPIMVFEDRVLVDSRNKRLMDLKWGRPYNYMLANFFPFLRNASIQAFYSQTTQEPVAAETSINTENPLVGNNSITVTDSTSSGDRQDKTYNILVCIDQYVICLGPSPQCRS